MLSVRRNVSRRRFNDELGAGVAVDVGVAGDVDAESSLLSWRTNKSSVLIAVRTNYMHIHSTHAHKIHLN